MRDEKGRFIKGHKPATMFKKGRISPPTKGWTGKKMPLEMRKKMSEAKKGSKCYNWKGGITAENTAIRNSLRFRKWRMSVFARDKFTCQDCGQVGNTLNAHHIKSFANYPKLRFDINNGVTLCVDCHKYIHKIKLPEGGKNETKKKK